MSDTLQYMSWHLQYACPFRQADAVNVLREARHATSKLRLINDMEAGGDVYGDIIVMGVSYSREGRRPCSGFRISDAVAPAGDLAAARRTCGECPANAFPPPKMAGCCGSLDVDPDDAEVGGVLRATIDQGLVDEFSAAFVQTQPIWYGLWISDPLLPAQLKLLPQLLENIVQRGNRDVEQFRRACSLALEHGIELRVHMPPPGHVDFGFYTVFPHCPRCKCGTGERFSRHSNQMTICKACGWKFIPADTASSEEDDFNVAELHEQLTAEEYAALCKAWEERHASDPPDPWWDRPPKK